MSTKISIARSLKAVKMCISTLMLVTVIVMCETTAKAGEGTETTFPTKSFPIDVTFDNAKAQEMLDVWNAYRRDLGLNEITMHPMENAYAQVRCAQIHFFSGDHRTAGKEDDADLIKKYMSYEADRYLPDPDNPVRVNAIENIILSGDDAQKTFEILCSDQHRASLIAEDLRFAGIAYSTDGYWILAGSSEADKDFLPETTDVVTVTGTVTKHYDIDIYTEWILPTIYNSFTYVGAKSVPFQGMLKDVSGGMSRYPLDTSMFTTSSETPELISVNGDNTANPIAVGDAQIRISLKSDPSFTNVVTIKILPCNIAQVKIDGVKVNGKAVLEQKTYTYTGSPITPKPKVYDPYGNLLQEDVDYTLEYSNNIEVGKGSIWIRGINNYNSAMSGGIFTIEKATVPETEAGTEPETEPVTEPITEHNTEPETEPVTELITELTTEGPIEPETEPVTEHNSEPETEPITEPSQEPETGSEGHGEVQDPVNPEQGQKETETEVQPAVSMAIKLEKDKYQYTGKNIYPKLCVFIDGVKLKPNDYTVQYKAVKKPGLGTVIVVGKGRYGRFGAKEQFKILPPKIALSKLIAKKGKASIIWKANKLVDGYQIQVCRNKKFKKPSEYTIKGAKKAKKNIKLKKGLYYVRIRGYKSVKAEKILGKWSSTRKVRIK